jgi:putative transposase
MYCARKFRSYRVNYTVHAILGRHELAADHSRRRRCKAPGTHLSLPKRPNDLWYADYKGEFMLADSATATR